MKQSSSPATCAALALGIRASSVACKHWIEPHNQTEMEPSISQCPAWRRKEEAAGAGKGSTHRLEVKGEGLGALKLVDHLGAPGISEEVQVGEPAPVDRLILVAQQQTHEEQQHRHIGG